ncbi:LPS translocon maturation chaperone LptM [Thalassomonas actiniarum]|uniref:Lipoprotein n=1 Tax=Thalassomonas actiniarum TaxID=485447 RepID=A0AAF0C3J0_9GAMM|nr:lipoprotein [Thalassomonas actiniarum]WDD99008.1 lipoprotein [Thalassomonas actiniarum]
MSIQANKTLLLGGLFSILVLTACGNKGPLYQTPSEEVQQAESKAEERHSGSPEQEK